VPGVLDEITGHALQLHRPGVPPSADGLTPAGLATALRSVLQPSYSPFRPAEPPGGATDPAQDSRSRRQARHLRAGLRHRATLLRPAA